MAKFKILVCCHKDTPRMKDSVFTPILLGSAYADDKLKEAFKDDYWDNMGTNIAELHPYCAELSAIYWAWKNYDRLGNPDHIGLFHYRRLFNFSEPIGDPDLWKCAFFDFEAQTRNRFKWNEEEIDRFCSGHDLILPCYENILDPKDWKTPASLETHYKRSHYPEDFDKAKDLICRTFPQYAESVERACSSKTGHFCNMFIMTREMFFDYAQWLFSIILPLKDLLKVESSKYNGTHEDQKRVLGFLGERLFNIWIDHQKSREGINIRETERLTGYITDKDRALYIKKYGSSEYENAQKRSKLCVEQQRTDSDTTVDNTEMLVHNSRMTKVPAVSVLLPVYNVGEYLRSCIESLICQTLKDIEIVFVYDISQDDSLDILMEYYKTDPRITVVENKQRGGMARARNIGMKFARGKYFAFVDSDDICDMTMFEKLYSKAEKLKADIVTCSVWGFYDTVDNKYMHRQLEWFGDSDKLLPLSGRPQQLMEPAAWCKLFRTEYIKSLDYFEFRPGVVSWEDVPAMTSAFTQTERIATVQEALYYYRQRTEGNLSNNMTQRYVDEFISGAKSQSGILEKHGPDDWMFKSYIEEFKCLFAEWMLSKLDKKDVPYFFHHVGCLFKLRDRQYLHRVFSLYPKRRLFYDVLITRSCAVYYLGKWLLRVRRGLKSFIKRVFGIKREGIYWTFCIGPLHFKKLRKLYCLQTIEWLENKSANSESHVCQLLDEKNGLLVNNSELQKIADELRISCAELHKANATLRKNDGDILDRIADLKERYDALLASDDDLHKNKEMLQANNADLRANNDDLRKNISELLASNEDLRRNEEVLQANTDKLQAESSNLHKALEAYEREAGGFYHAVWTTGWVDVWKHYYYRNYESISAKIAALKVSLDEESCSVIDRLCYRNFRLLPMQADSKLFLYDHQHIYTPAELAGAAQPLDEAYFRKKYVIPEDEYLETPVFRFNCGLPVLPESAIQQIKGRDAIDGGAYWGDSALIIYDYAPRKIYAFEPQPASFEKLKRTISGNNLDSDVVAIRGGLGDKQEVRHLYTNGMMSGSSLMDVTPSLCDAEAEINDADIFTLDEFVKEHSLDVGLIKLDIEGNELAAIHGAIETIRKYRPILDIAVYHQPQDFFEIKPLIEALNLGYKFYIRKLVFHDLVTEVVLLGYSEIN